MHASEVIEHLEYPYEFIMEAARVAKKYVIIGTAEAGTSYMPALLRQYLLPDPSEPHCHRSVWTREDFASLLDKDIVTVAQHGKIRSGGVDYKELVKGICSQQSRISQGVGIMFTHAHDNNAPEATEAIDDDLLLDYLFEHVLPLKPIERWDDAVVDAEMLDVLCCPLCGGDLRVQGNMLQCGSCLEGFQRWHGVPDLFRPEPAEIEALLKRVGTRSALSVSQRMEWIARRKRQFDRRRRVKSPRAVRMLRRVIGVVESLDSEQTFAGKAKYMLAKVFAKVTRHSFPDKS